jgi:tetratricopeptide (TPR) repeat protein
LEGLDEVNDLEPNNAFILHNRENVKTMLDDYQKVLEDFDKVVVLDPNNALILQSCGIIKKQVEGLSRSLGRP